MRGRWFTLPFTNCPGKAPTAATERGTKVRSDNTRPDAWWFTFHAEQRRAEMLLSAEEVTDALDDPVLIYPSRGLRIAVGGRLAVVHDPASRAIVTVLWDGLEGRAA